MKFSLTFCLFTLVAIFGTTVCLKCKKVCRKIYDPYCLTYEDGTKATFPNKCVLDIEICLNGLSSKNESLIGTRGACDEEYSSYLDNIEGLDAVVDFDVSEDLDVAEKSDYVEESNVVNDSNVINGLKGFVEN